jgi:hypothetical protein
MKTISRLSSLMNARFLKIFFSLSLAVAVSACSDESADVAPSDDAAGKKASAKNSNDNSTSGYGDYNIQVSREGSVWTYVITKNPGAKGLSHFVLNLQNCALRSSTIDNILWATVNGEPAKLSNSEGNTGCDVSEVTTNFVKFDDLPDADSYTIKFEFDKVIGNYVTSTAWLKAGTSCVKYPVIAPCCPL